MDKVKELVGRSMMSEKDIPVPDDFVIWEDVQITMVELFRLAKESGLFDIQVHKALSHPDLCLIDRGRELPENRYADDYYAGSGARPAAYEKAWQDALKAGYLPVISLAQALEVK